MCWKCDNPNGTTEQYLDGLRATIDDHGWAVQGVEDDKRPFTYTVGLHGQGLSELIITGMATHTAARLLNSIAHMITEDGTVLAPATHIDHQDEFLFEVIAVDHPDVHLRYSTMLFGDGVRALQLVWADARGRWPWDAGWGHGRRRQPVLGVRAQVPPLQG